MTNPTDPTKPLPTLIEPDGTPHDGPSPADRLIIPPADDYHDTTDGLPHLEPVHRTGSFYRDIQTTATGADGPLNNMRVNLNNVPYFVDFVTYYNFPKDTPAHALLFYALQLGYALEDPDLGNISIDSPDYPINPRGMLTGICLIYGTEPEAAVRYWPEVDRLLATLNLTPIPDTPFHRHITLNKSAIAAAIVGLMNEKVASDKDSS